MSSSPSASPLPASQSLETQKTRNKLNQRAFRQRRQQRVQELEEKLRQYESAQLKATQQMQQAARIVAAENAMLRDVLKQRLGIGEMEIEAMRREWIAGNEPATATRGGRATKSSDGGQNPGKSRHESQDQQEYVEDVAHHMNLQTQPFTEETSQTPCCGPSSQNDNGANQNQQEVVETTNHYTSRQSYSSIEEPDRVHCCGQPSRDKDGAAPGIQYADSSVSMSCEKAAEILSSIRSQDELHDVRVRLGCTSTSTRMIPNTRIMDVMNDSI